MAAGAPGVGRRGPRRSRVRCASVTAATAVAISGLAGCAPAPLQLSVEFAGCETVLRGPVCVAGDDPMLTLWIATEPGAVVTVDGRTPAEPPVEVQGGRRWRVALPATTAVVVESRLGRARARWTLPVVPSRRPEWQAQARRLAGAGDFAGAAALCEPRLASPSPEDRGPAAAILARIALRDGDGERAAALLRQSIAAHREAGDLQRELNDGLVLVTQLLPRREFVAARRLLAELPSIDGCAEAGFHRALNLGFLSSQTGDLRSAERHLAAAAAQAERLGILEGRYRILIEEVRTQGLQRQGRLAEAAARLDALAAAELRDPCDRAKLLNDRAWGLLLAREAGRPLGDPEPLLAAALEIFDQSCRLPDERRNVLVNLALAAVHRGDHGAARRRLAEAQAIDPEHPLSNLHLWAWDVEARVRLAEARPAAAIALYDELAARARELESPEAEWRVAFWRAQAREEAADLDGALADYRRAEALLEREQLLVPVHVGRDTFVAQRERATRGHLELLLGQGRDAEALALVRRARGRYLSSVRRFTGAARLADAEREAWDRSVAAYQAERLALDEDAAASWRLPGDAWRAAEERRRARRRALRDRLDELLAVVGEPRDGTGTETGAGAGAAAAPPAPGELLLAYHPLDDGWVGLAADAGGVVARRLGAVDPEATEPEALAARLLEPFADRLAAAREVRVLAHGTLWGVDFHALPFAGAPLVAGRRVVYALDLPRRGGGAASLRRALLVADPEGDLPGARREAAAVAGALGRRLAVRRLTGVEATGPALRERLAESDLFHYAGHGVSAGWDSRLPLAGDGGLTVDDVVVLAPAPGLVVLSGCETAAIPPDAPAEGMGLAHAFLVAGARTVVATARRVPDAAAAALVAAFYRELVAGSEPAEALRRAQLARAADGDGGAWASFRVIEP